MHIESRAQKVRHVLRVRLSVFGAKMPQHIAIKPHTQQADVGALEVA